MMRRHISLALGWMLLATTIAGAQQNPALPDGAVARLGVHRLRVPAKILDAAFAPDGCTFVVVYHQERADKPNVVLFDVATGLERKKFDIFQARHVAIARHKPLMALDTNSGFEVWDLAKEKRVCQWPHPEKTFKTLALAISPDGTQVVAPARVTDDGVVILRWNVADGKPLPSLYPKTDEVPSVSFSADGKKILSIHGSTTGAVVGWNAKTGEKLTELANAHDYGVLSPDGSKVAFGMLGKMILVVDRASEKTMTTLTVNHARFVFTPDGNQLVIMAQNQPNRLWDIAGNKEVRVFEGSPWASTLQPQFTQDGRLLAATSDSGANGVQFWDVTTGLQLRYPTGHPGAVNGLAYSPDGRRLATISNDTLLVYDPTTGQELRRWVGHKAAIEQIAFAPDGKLLASASIDATIGLWDPATGKERRRLSAKHPVQSLVFAPDGSTLTAACQNQGLQIWDVDDGKLVRSRDVPMKMAMPRLSPPGQYFVFLTDPGKRDERDGLLHWINAHSGKMLASLDLRFKGTRFGRRSEDFVAPGVAFSPDGKLLATSDSQLAYGERGMPSNHTVRVWETATQREILRLSGNPVGTRLLAFSPDGRILAHGFGHPGAGGRGAEQMIVLRDLAAAQSVMVPATADYGIDRHVLMPFLRPIGGHHGSITCLAFSPDGKFLATGGSDQVVFVWRVWDFFARLEPAQADGDVADLWPHLADADAGKAYRAIAQLEQQPQEALAMLRKHLRAVPRGDEKVIAQHLRNLASANFPIRQLAYAALEKSGIQAVHLVRQAVKNPADLEAKRRLEMLLQKLDNPTEDPSQLRTIRCLTLLERINAAEARRLLEELSQGAPAAWLTTEARHSLLRRGRWND